MNVLSPPSEIEIKDYLIDRIIGDARIYEKTIFIQYVREGNYFIRGDMAYIGAKDESSIKTIDFNLRI